MNEKKERFQHSLKKGIKITSPQLGDIIFNKNYYLILLSWILTSQIIKNSCPITWHMAGWTASSNNNWFFKHTFYEDRNYIDIFVRYVFKNLRTEVPPTLHFCQ